MQSRTHQIITSTFRFSYEAAVCGGIPVINALQTDFVADDITNVMGIMNGTELFQHTVLLCAAATHHCHLNLTFTSFAYSTRHHKLYAVKDGR